MKLKLFSFFIVAATLVCSLIADTIWVASGSGVYSVNFNPEDGKIRKVDLAVAADRVGFIGLHPSLPILYAATGRKEGKLEAYSIKASRKLKKQNAIGTKWGGSSSLGISPQGDLVSVAYYAAGSFGVYGINEDGSLSKPLLEVEHEGSSVHQGRQKKPRPHWSGFSPDGRFIFVPDLGTDHIWIYAVSDDRKSVTLHRKVDAAKAGFGPRHFVLHPSGKFGYLTDELVGGVTAFRFDDKDGNLTPIQSLTSAPEAVESERFYNVSDLEVHPSGRFLYVANRGHDTVSVFSIDQKTGYLTPVEREPVRGSWPRHLKIDSSGRWFFVTGDLSETLAVFEIDQENGSLEYTRGILSVPKPGRMEITP